MEDTKLDLTSIHMCTFSHVQAHTHFFLRQGLNILVLADLFASASRAGIRGVGVCHHPPNFLHSIVLNLLEPSPKQKEEEEEVDSLQV